MEYSQTLQADQRSTLYHVLTNKQFCDVTFIVGPDEIRLCAIRALMASISPVFEAMLFGSMVESHQNSEITIPDVDASAFQTVIKFGYCNNPEINADNVVQVHD
eukprot:310006_1